MKKFSALFMLALLTACPLPVFGQTSLEKDPAYLPIDNVLDLNTIQPKVNVNLPHFLLKDALAGLTNVAGLETNDIADVLKDIKLIRVVVIEPDQNNRAALDKGIKALRNGLEKKWTAIVNVPENNVGVFAMSDPAGESTAGLAVLVYDHGDAVIVNIVGNVSIAKLMKIASQSNQLPRDFLKNLPGFGPPTKKPTATKSSDSGSSTNVAGAGPQIAAEGSSAK